MNKVIEITIRNKVARIASSPIIVGKNKDYIVRFNFDEDWDKYDTKTARFSQDGEYQDIIFAGNECSMPALDGGKVVEVGVYAGDISTTTPAYLKVQKSIIDDDGVPTDPQPDVYAQLMERLNELEAPAAVLYTVQNLTDEQKAQARDNIGVNESLGITGAIAGQVPAVKAVDASGVPTEWESVELPSGAYIVNLTMGADGSITADKTFAEIKAASDDGKVVDAKFDDVIVPLCSLFDSDAIFAMTNANSFKVSTVNLMCTSDNVWSMSQNGFDAHTLGISGASVGQIVKIKTVDESGAPTGWEPADMPSGSGGGTDTSLGLTGATVGQVPVVKTVDASGVPTEWEAADAASGENWEFINEISTNEWISSVTINQDSNGNPFSLKKMRIFMTLPKTTNEAGEEQSNAGYAYYAVNGMRPAWQNPSNGWNNALFLWTIEALGDYYTVTCFKDGANAAELWHSDIFKSEGAFSTITKFEWRLFNGTMGWSSTNFKVYGVKA